MRFTFAPEARPLEGYTIKRAIDRGGFGEVYYALSDSGKEVPLKLLQQNQQVELRGVSQCLNLKHPNLVTLFDIRTDADGEHWVVMEYVAEKSLEQVLDEHPNGLPLAEVEQWLSGIAAGIAFLHDRGIVHRDLKPANIFRENGVVKIGDVGLSKFMTPSRRSAQTESVGTVYYMAPEVAHGKYGKELDVYSLGVIVYEMLTGRVPFDGESTAEILMKHLTKPPDLNVISPAFRPILARALEKDPTARIGNATQLANEFRNALRYVNRPVEIPQEAFINGNGHKQTDWDASQKPQSQTADDRGARHESPQRPGQQRRCDTRRSFDGSTIRKELRHNPWLFLAVAVGVTVFLMHSVNIFNGIFRFPMKFLLGSWFFLAVLSALSYATYRLVAHFLQTSQEQAEAPRRPLDSFAPTMRPPIPAAPVLLERQQPATSNAKSNPPRVNVHLLVPETPRPVAWRQRLSELSLSMTSSVVLSLLATTGVGFFSSIFGDTNQYAVDMGRVGLFALVTILGSWAILIPCKLWEGKPIDARTRRLTLAGLGAVVGFCAYQLDELLMVDVPYKNSFRGMVDQIAGERLLTDAIQPTCLGYMVFFAALFGLRRWWWQADTFRPQRFRVASTAFTALLAYLLPAVLAFPQPWAASWGVALSCVVQLAADWVPVQTRAARLEGH